MLQGQTTDLRFALNENKTDEEKKMHILSLNIVLELEISFHVEFPINNMHSLVASISRNLSRQTNFRQTILIQQHRIELMANKKSWQT